MRQFKLCFCSLLLLIANAANSQTSESNTPDVEELTDGMRAFTCEDSGKEMPLIFVQEDSKWRLVGIQEADLITEINEGFMIRYSSFPGELSFLKEARATFQYQYLSSDGYYEAECKEQDDFLELVVEVISSKVVENATTLSQTVGKLENKLRKLEDIQDTLNEARETNRKNFIRFNIEKEALTSKYESELSLQTEKLLSLNSRLTKAGNTAGNLLINQLNADKKTQEAIFNTSLNADNKVREQLVEKFDLYNAKLGPYCVNRFLFKPTEIDEECRTGIIQHIFN